MSVKKPSIAKGTRDFNAAQVAKRSHIFEVMAKHFKRFGFEPIETPSFEKNETLMGKYGDEGDQLLFKILNSGNFLSKVAEADLTLENHSKLTSKITEKALRYDLTVPFARYVVQHQNELTFPFKRYQMQPVWRADRPQKGRFREFYQCDADVIGSDSIWQEVDFIQLYDQVFTDLGLKGVCLKINHRKILEGIAEVIDAQDKLLDFTVALDKLDKIGIDGVKKEMMAKGIAEASVEKLVPILALKGDDLFEKLTVIEALFSESEAGKQGVAELRFILAQVQHIGLDALAMDLDLTLARGLNYYTGSIFEVKAPKEVGIGSIGGGGRYDDLTGIFGLKGMSGVGISFGVDRIYLAMEHLNLLGDTETTQPQILFVNFGDKEALHSAKAIAQLRKEGIRCELYPDSAKLKKQFAYAHKKAIPYVVMVGSEEIENDTYTVKNMEKGSQETVNLSSLLKIVLS